MVKHRLRRVTLAAAVIAIATVSAACSSSGGKSGTTSTSGGTSSRPSSSQTAAAPTGTPIKIGVAAAQTGVAASLFKDAADVTKAWASAVNAAGGIAGHPVSIDLLDTKSDPATGLADVKQLISDKVSALMIMDTNSEAQAAPAITASNIPVLGTGYTPLLFAGTTPNVYAPQMTILDGDTASIAIGKQLGLKKVGFTYCAEAPVCAQVAPFVKQATTSAGLSYEGGLSISASAPDYTAQCLQLANKGTDYLILGLSGEVAGRVAGDCLKQGYKGTFGSISGSWDISAMKQASGATFVGPSNSFPWWVSDQPVQAYRDAVTKYAPSADYRGFTQTAVWANLSLFAKALASAPAGPLTATDVANGYASLKDETLGGLLPAAVNYTVGKATALPRCYWQLQYKGGDADPTIIKASGTSGNGQTGDLATTCLS
jgi:branched-chain amino acid transport system substrate-binding protein